MKTGIKCLFLTALLFCSIQVPINANTIVKSGFRSPNAIFTEPGLMPLPICPDAVSNNVISTSDATTICSGETISFTGTEPTITPSIDSTFQWQSKTGAGSWTNILNATAIDYTTNNLIETTVFRRLVEFVDCATLYASNEITITVNAVPSAPNVNVQNNCGESVLTASDYTGSLLWSTGETTASITVSSAGDYSVTQTIDGCTSSAVSETAAPKTVPTLGVTENDPAVCLGQGSLVFSFTGVPDGTYTINYDGGSFTGVSIALNAATVSTGAGTYNNLKITVDGCTSADGVNATLTDPSPPSAPTVNVQNNCGESVLTASDYTGSLLWSNDSTTASITVSVADDYSVTQTVDGCTSSAASGTAAPKAIPTLGVTENDPVVCLGQGSLVFSFTGVPDETYTINYDGGSFTGISVASNAATVLTEAGAYNNLKITVDGCVSANGISASLSDPNPPSAPTVSVQNNCGESVLTASNYTGSLLWSNDSTTESITVSTAGDYSVTQIVGGCTSDAATGTAAPKAIPTLGVTENDPTVCLGQGSLVFSFTGVPDETYTINYDGGSFTGVSVASNAATVSTGAGTYNNLKITVDGCVSANGINATLTDPPPPSVPTVNVQNNCGESVLTASDYTGSLLWSTGETTASITVSSAGDYSVTQTVDGCTSSAASGTAAPKTIPTLGVTENDPVVCLGQGSLVFSFTGVPDGTYTIDYDGGSFINTSVTTGAATILTGAGTYNNLKITVDGCVSANGISASLSDPNPPSAPTVSVQNHCGESVLTASNYTGSLLWSNDSTTASITVSTAGDYSVTQIVGGCTSDAAIGTATPKAIPTLGVTENDPTVCLGQGSLVFSFTGVPDETYTINYDGGTFTGVSVASNAATVLTGAGTYNNLKITVDGCTSADGVNATLTDPSPPSAPTVNVQNNCGESVLTASYYTGSLLWNTGETTASITVSSAGDYSVTQTVNGCTSSPATGTAAPKTIPTLAVTENNPTVCLGQGSLVFSFTGVPDGTYTISYDGGSFTNVSVSSNTATILTGAGAYNNLKVTANGCTSANAVNAILSDPNPPSTPTINVQNNCGQSTLSATNYSGSLLWSTGATSPGITVFSTGNYSLTQTVNGCTSDATSALAEPKSIPTLAVTETDPTACFGQGSLDFIFTGVPDGTYAINYDGGSFIGVAASDNTAKVLITTGTYNNLKITVDGCSSANGVHASLSDPNPPPTPTIDVQNNCGESVLSVSDYSGALLWSTGETTESITVNQAGDYSVTQTINGCVSDAATTTATPKTIPTLAVSEVDPTLCQGQGSLNFTFNNVPDGTYSIAYDGSSFTDVVVSSNSATVSSGAGAYNNLKITVDGCISSDGINASLSDPNPPPTPSISVQNNCGESVLTASDYSGSLLWSTGETTESITVNVAGNYSLTQTVAGCTSDAASALAAPKTIPTLTVSVNDPSACLELGSLDFTFTGVPNGTYSINYDGGSFTSVAIISNEANVIVESGIYNNLIITVDGCSSASGINVSLSDPNPPSAPVIDVQDNCGESVLTASDYSGALLWSTGETTESITVSSPGSYSVTQIVSNCPSDATIANATPKKIPELGVTTVDPTLCLGQGLLNFTFNNVPDGTYSIAYDGNSFAGVVVSSNSATVSSGAGAYNNLKVKVDGCVSPAGINANLSDPNPPPTPSISVQNKCGESILTASDFTGSLLWSTGETTESITVDAAGNYSLTQMVAGCTSNANSEVANPKSIPTLSVISYNDTLCQGQGSLGFDFTEVPDGTYTISYDGNSFSNVVVTSNKATVFAEAGIYNNLKITVDDCTSADGVSATLSNPAPPPAPSITVENNCGESVLIASNYIGSLLWSTGETAESITVSQAGEYSLTQTTNGCTSEAVFAQANPNTSSLKPEIMVENNCGESTIIMTNLAEGNWFFWEFDNVTDSTQAKSIIVTQAGNYNIRQKNQECTSSPLLITVNIPNAPSDPIGEDLEICSAEATQTLFAKASTTEENTSVVWFDKATGGNVVLSPSLDTIGSATYYAQAKDTLTNCLSNNRTPVTLTIKPNPKILIPDTVIVGKPNNNVAVLIFPTEAMKYQWFLNGDEINNATKQYYYVFESDRKNSNTFAIEVEVPNGCKAKFAYKYSRSLNGSEINAENHSEDSNKNKSFIIFPNPANNKFNIAIDSKRFSENIKISAKIYSANGVLMMEESIVQHPHSIDINHLTPGLYIITLVTNDRILGVEKLTISKQ